MGNSMRYKAAILALIIGAASLLCVIFASASVSRAMDDVSFRIVQSSGDLSWAEGLKLNYTERGASIYYMKYEIEFGSAGQDAVLSSKTAHDSVTNSLYRQSMRDIVVSINFSRMINRAVEDLKVLGQELKAGENRELTLKLSDYCEYMDLAVSWNAPGNTFEERDPQTTDYDYDSDRKKDYIYEQFLQYFSKQAAEGEMFECSVGKYSDGTLHYTIHLQSDPYRVQMQLTGVLCGDYYYLAAAAASGSDYDLSRKVWRIPCGTLPEAVRSGSGPAVTKGPIADRTELLLTVDEAFSLTGNYPVFSGEDKNTVFIHTRNGDDTRIYCAANASSDRPSVSIVDVPGYTTDLDNELINPWSCLLSEDSMFFRGPGNTIYCIHPEGSRYTLTVFPEDVDVAVPIKDTDTLYLAQILKCAYKDGKLAVVRYANKRMTYKDGEKAWAYIGLNVSVCSTEKVECSILLESSIMQGAYFRDGRATSAGYHSTDHLTWK